MRTRTAILSTAMLVAISGLLCPRATPLVTSQVASHGSEPDNHPVRIGVLSLFNPTELRVRPTAGGTLILELGGHSSTLTGDAQASVTRAEDSQIRVQLPGDRPPLQGASLKVHSPSRLDLQNSTTFWLEVPGKLRRSYTGTLEIRTPSRKDKQALEAIVTLPLETAVASIVQAESPPGATMESLKAQAVAARSFLIARQTSHVDFDFCDTTHCQFLRSPPSPASSAARAARATQGLVLTWHDDATAQDQTLPAMYARSCGGRTRTLGEIGVHSHGYPYYAVRCSYCTRHPEVWQRETRGSHPKTEQDRLTFNRTYGWGAIPSISATPLTPLDQRADSIAGRGIGHGLGLCQLGAADMARHGATFAHILAHYYPNTRIAGLPSPSN
jgi:Stage II sporulation protein